MRCGRVVHAREWQMIQVLSDMCLRVALSSAISSASRKILYSLMVHAGWRPPPSSKTRKAALGGTASWGYVFTMILVRGSLSLPFSQLHSSHRP